MDSVVKQMNHVFNHPNMIEYKFTINEFFEYTSNYKCDDSILYHHLLKKLFDIIKSI